MSIPFVKMHGAGNDFVMLDGIDTRLPDDLSSFSKQICHRRFGVGADQILIVRKSDVADFCMDIYNADGGRVEMCGNGIRCFAKYVRDLGLTKKTELKIETLGGMIKPKIILDHPKTTNDTVWVSVDMGEPILDAARIPTLGSGQIIDMEWAPKDISSFLPSDPKNFRITAVSMGNPHCVIFVDDVKNFPVERVGRVIENDPFFPNRVNVEFVQVLNRKTLVQRTWERGSGETYACGTGASAVMAAGVLNKKCDRSATIQLKGGDLDLSWNESNNRIFKTGPATTVFRGEW